MRRDCPICFGQEISSHYCECVIFTYVQCLLLEILFQAMSQKSTDQLGSLKEEHQKELSKMQQEVESLKASVEAKTKEVNEKNATLLQVRICPNTFDHL